MKIFITDACSLPGYRAIVEALKRRHEVVGLYYIIQYLLRVGGWGGTSIDISRLDDLRILIVKVKFIIKPV